MTNRRSEQYRVMKQSSDGEHDKLVTTRTGQGARQAAEQDAAILREIVGKHYYIEEVRS